VEKILTRVAKQAKTGDKLPRKLRPILEQVQSTLNEGRPVRAMGLEPEQLALLKRSPF
jgi:hypothetical protein